MRKAIWGDSSLFFFLLGWAGISFLAPETLPPHWLALLPSHIQKDVLQVVAFFLLIVFLFAFSSVSRRGWQYGGVFFSFAGMMVYILPEILGNSSSLALVNTFHWIYLVTFSSLGVWVGTVFRRTDLVWIFCFLFVLLDIVLSLLPFPGFSEGEFSGKLALIRAYGNPILLFFLGYFIQITYSLNLTPIRTFFGLILGVVLQMMLEKMMAFLPFGLFSLPSLPVLMVFFFLFQWRELKPKREELWMALGFSVLFLFMLIFGWVMLWLSKRMG
ncbi:MAG: hypothetical protein ACK4G3_04615 [bacterium]